MAKYSKATTEWICKLISKDSYTISEICAMVGISDSCFYNWQARNVEFREAVSRAREQFDEILVKEAKNSLRKKVNGYDVEEKKTVYVNDKDGKPKVKEHIVTIKHFDSDIEAIKLVLTNKAPNEYKNRQSNEVTGKEGQDLFASLSDKRLEEKIEKLEHKLGRGIDKEMTDGKK